MKVKQLRKIKFWKALVQYFIHLNDLTGLIVSMTSSLARMAETGNTPPDNA